MPSPGEEDHSPHLLIVDDHRNTRESMALGLAGRNVQVTTAASGEEALAVLSEQSVDWLISAVRMPMMNGIELAERAKALQPALRVVLMTAYDVSEDERRRIAGSAAELLIKPVTADRLVDEYVNEPRVRQPMERGTSSRVSNGREQGS